MIPSLIGWMYGESLLCAVELRTYSQNQDADLDRMQGITVKSILLTTLSKTYRYHPGGVLWLCH